MCSEQPVDVFNPPDNKRIDFGQARVSLRNGICGCKAFKIILDIVAGVQEHVPKTCSL